MNISQGCRLRDHRGSKISATTTIKMIMATITTDLGIEWPVAKYLSTILYKNNKYFNKDSVHKSHKQSTTAQEYHTNLKII